MIAKCQPGPLNIPNLSFLYRYSWKHSLLQMLGTNLLLTVQFPGFPSSWLQKVWESPSLRPTCALAMTSTSHMAVIVLMNVISSSVGMAAK